MPWFRRRKNAAADAAAGDTPVEARPEPDVVETAPAAADGADATTDPTKPKRRRGSRGGRGRKKTSSTSSAAASVDDESSDEQPKPAARKTKTAERKTQATERKTLSQRQERRRSQGSRRREAPRRAPLPKAKRELIVSVDVGEQRVAVLEDDKVAEVYLERPERRSIAGNIYLGRVDNVLPGMEAAFVEIGLEKNGFLYVDEIVGPELERGHGRKIQDLINKGQTILVQSVKDPMKTKGARLTTQISLPGRFVVFVPQGEGLGVSRRLDDDERQRLKEILKKLDVKEGGLIVRTAAEGASEEDIERDIVFLQRLWKSIQAKAKEATAPELIYQEAELPLRVTRDLFTGDFVKAYVDNDQAYKRITGYLKKTSPHMVDRVVRYRDKPPLMEHFGVEQEIKSTLSRRVDLPSGGYLIFDYAEAFTVIDVNTGRFVGSRGKNAGGRLEDTITKNNLEAVKEVVRQLRLRDIGGIIVIDFIDMANPKNRATVEEALRSELERDRTKTYVVEISPLGLVEMTRQNVTDGPREVMTRKCPTCGGDGIVYSDASAAIDVERRLRALVTGSRSQAYRVELAAPIAAALVGPGASRLMELEALTKRRFFLDGKPDTHVDHFVVVAEGKLEDLAPQAPVAEGAELMLELVEVDRHDGTAAVGKVEGFDVCVGNAAELVGKRVKVRVERVLDGTAYASLVRKAGKAAPEPLTAEAEAEKPTRKPPARKATGATEEPEAVAVEADVEEETLDAAEELDEGEATEAAIADGAEAPPAKKKTRRGSRGGRKRKKPAAATANGDAPAADDALDDAPDGAPDGESHESADREAGAEETAERARTVKIHVPTDDLGREDDEDEAGETAAEGANGAQPAAKKTRRGSRGGKNRRKRAERADGADGRPAATEAAEAPSRNGADADPPADHPAGDAGDEEWGYVPMSEWGDEFS
ncbi:MAG TPA: Rne/Rng family ribonuclease [Gaiellaceae bacterium]|nr:Rne/Rng family ribonuclease [Gaiellaceae bacterium]